MDNGEEEDQEFISRKCVSNVFCSSAPNYFPFEDMKVMLGKWEAIRKGKMYMYLLCMYKTKEKWWRDRAILIMCCIIECILTSQTILDTAMHSFIDTPLVSRSLIRSSCLCSCNFVVVDKCVGYMNT